MNNWQPSSTRSSSTLGGRLQVRSSRCYRIAWLCLVLAQAGVLVLLIQRLPLWVTALLLLVQLWLLALSYRVPQQGEILRWRGDQWWVWRDGRWLAARLGSAIVLFPWLTAFTLESGQSRHFLLFNDGADRTDLHRLRVQLALCRPAAGRGLQR